MTYEPRSFWEERLVDQFDLRGTGEPGLSLEYNRACYALRRFALDRALAGAGFDPKTQRVLDVGCGTGFFVEYYLERGARVTGLDLTDASVARLSARFPQARFIRADVADQPVGEEFDLVNVFDVFFHITEDPRWEAAMAHVARGVAPGGLLVYTDVFAPPSKLAAHNRTRPLERHQALLERLGLRVESLAPTHVLLNRELGPARFLNRFPRLLQGIDRGLLGAGIGRTARSNLLLVARRLR
jgi:SAM-dependent methyltransferase